MALREPAIRVRTGASERDAGDTIKRSGWTVGASAAAGATALVAFTSAWAPWLPSGVGAWADAVINEWIVWFTGLYLALLVVVSFAERLGQVLDRLRQGNSRPSIDGNTPGNG